MNTISNFFRLSIVLGLVANLALFSCGGSNSSKENSEEAKEYDLDDMKVSSDESKETLVLDYEGQKSTFSNEGVWPNDLPGKLSAPEFAEIFSFMKEEKTGQNVWVINFNLEDEDYSKFVKFFEKAGYSVKVNQVGEIFLGIKAETENVQISLIPGVINIVENL